MENNLDKKNMKTKNETEELKQEENSLRATTAADLTEQNIIQDIQKNDMTLSLNKIEIKKPHYFNKGNVHMFLFDENSVPRIVIGPNCKKKIKI